MGWFVFPFPPDLIWTLLSEDHSNCCHSLLLVILTPTGWYCTKYQNGFPIFPTTASKDEELKKTFFLSHILEIGLKISVKSDENGRSSLSSLLHSPLPPKPPPLSSSTSNSEREESVPKPVACVPGNGRKKKKALLSVQNRAAGTYLEYALAPPLNGL